MNSFLKALRESVPESLRGFRADLLAVDCHHNYVNREFHFGEDLLITRKGAVCAEKGRYGIIPGSMGAKSFIVQGKGNAESYNSCSHGAGKGFMYFRRKKVLRLLRETCVRRHFA